MWRRTCLALVTLGALMTVGALVTGCAAPGGSPAAPPPGAPTSPAPLPATPLALIGNWTVAGVAEQPDGILRLASGDIRLVDRCGTRYGSWRADAQGLFVAGLFSASLADGAAAACEAEAATTPRWLARAEAYRMDGPTPVLLDRAGAAVARLLPGAQPSPPPDVTASEVAPPEVDRDARRAFPPVAPLPAALTPAARDMLIGKWLPARGSRAAYVEFLAGGAWRGSDGCNGQGGRWVAGPTGALLATGGPSTDIGCDNVPVGAWMAAAWRAGLDGETLVLLDAGAQELGRLRRAG
jgi:hypothetical protein